MVKYGKVFRCKKGKFKGRLVKYRYDGKSKRLVLHNSNRGRRYRG